MAKIDVINNKMAMFMLCEAIGEDRDTIDIKADENGLYDVKILFNDQELNVERFIENLQRNYQDAVKKQAADLLSSEYDKMLGKIYESLIAKVNSSAEVNSTALSNLPSFSTF